jgi:flagella basal body P-ring formation protein FlgA
MKITLLVISFALCGGFAHGQLDHILAPVPTAPDATQAEETPGPPTTVHCTLTADDVLTELQKQLVSYFDLKGDLKLSFIRNWDTMTLPAKDSKITLTGYPPEGVTDSFALRFRIEAGGAEVGEYQVGIRAQLWQSVWVAQERLDRGQPVDRSLLSSQKVDVLREKQTYLSDETNPDGYDVAQGVGPGQPLSKQDIVERPLVHKGDVVEVIATEGTLDIHMKALALEDGGANALIKMRNLDSNKDFTAQILNENEVKVQF